MGIGPLFYTFWGFRYTPKPLNFKPLNPKGLVLKVWGSGFRGCIWSSGDEGLGFRASGLGPGG